MHYIPELCQCEAQRQAEEERVAQKNAEATEKKKDESSNVRNLALVFHCISQHS